MIGLLCFVLVVASPFKSKLRPEAENAVFRHQLNVVMRKLPGRVRLTNNDRWFFIQLYRWFPSILEVLTIIQPETHAGVAEHIEKAVPVGTQSCWLLISNRAMLLPYARGL
jgi:hypothetical protein